MTADACREWRGALGASALGQLDEAEELALRAHLDGCAACRRELRELQAVAAALPFADIERVVGDDREPPRRLGPQVLARVASARAESRRRRLRRALAVAAALVFVSAVAASVVIARDDDTSTTAVVLTGTDAEARVELRAIDAGTEVKLHASGLDDDWYWLWVTGDDGRRVPAGTFQGTDGSLDVTMTAALPLPDTRRVWVTDEADVVVIDGRL